MYVESHGAAECGGLEGSQSGECMWVNVFACDLQAKHAKCIIKVHRVHYGVYSEPDPICLVSDLLLSPAQHSHHRSCWYGQERCSNS